MFWTGAVAIAKLLTRHATATRETSESCASGITGTDENQETSSTHGRVLEVILT